MEDSHLSVHENAKRQSPYLQNVFRTLYRDSILNRIKQRLEKIPRGKVLNIIVIGLLYILCCLYPLYFLYHLHLTCFYFSPAEVVLHTKLGIAYILFLFIIQKKRKRKAK